MQLAKLKRHLILILLAIVSLSLSACETPELDWKGTIYVGSSDGQALVGKIDGKTVIVYPSEPQFDSMVCTDTFAELQESYKRMMDKCERWRK